MFFIIADDLTGASDSGIQFQNKGFSTYVLIDHEKEDFDVSNYDVISINTDTRDISSEKAYLKIHNLICKILAIYPEAKFYKKIDSLFRGNSIQELEAMLDTLGYNVAFLAPAFPEGNRIVKNGRISNNGTDINVLQIIKNETQKEVGFVSIDIMKSGFETVYEKIEELIKKKCRIILFDADSKEDLEKVYKVYKSKKNVLLCGSAGLVSSIEPKSKIVENEIELKESILLYTIGSQNRVTREQTENLMKQDKDLNMGILRTSKLVIECEAEIERVLSKLIENDKKKPTNTWLITFDTLFENPKEAIESNTDDYIKKNRKMVDALGKLAREITHYKAISKIVVTGGDTALEICQSFRANGISLKKEILPGIPCGEIIGGELNGAAIVTKSGGFGEAMAFIDIKNFFEE